jgi:hypothetical protein
VWRRLAGALAGAPALPGALLGGGVLLPLLALLLLLAALSGAVGGGAAAAGAEAAAAGVVGLAERRAAVLAVRPDPVGWSVTIGMSPRRHKEGHPADRYRVAFQDSTGG